MATSVPLPMAMPTSACGQRRRVVDAVAGHGDHGALGLQPATTAPSRSGSTSASTPSMPRRRATASAVVRLSPVSMTIRGPRRAAPRAPAGVVSLIGSATPISPPACRRPPGTSRSRPRARSASARPPGADVDPPSAIEAGVAERQTRPDPSRSRPCRSPSESPAASVSDSPRPAASGDMARPGDARCPAPGWRPGAAARLASQSRRGDRREDRRPSVRVPVLSTTRVSTFSSAPAPRRS